MPAPDLLLRLLAGRGPSGYEDEASAIWCDAARDSGLDVEIDVARNAIARTGAPVRTGGPGSGAPLLALFGHVDEIGVVVTHADERGFLAFRGLGGWTPEVLVGQRVELLGPNGTVVAVVAAKRDAGRREDKRALRIEELHLDVGARDREEALALVGLGDAGVLAGAPVDLVNGRLASRALDNRLGAYVALEVARRVAKTADARWEVAAVASVGEEATDYAGARAAAFSLEPAVAIAVDVTPATDVPGGDPGEHGEHRLGDGAILLRGPGADARVFDFLRETAEDEGVPYALEVTRGSSHTDADGVYVSRGGVRTGVVSIATRYLHTPVEVCELADVEACVQLLAAVARRPPPDWLPAG